MGSPENKPSRRERVHQQIREWLVEDCPDKKPFGTTKFLAISDLATSMLWSSPVDLASIDGREAYNYYLQCLMQQAVVSETIRFRRDTVPGYNEAFNHAQHDFYGPLWLAEIDHPPTLLDHQLKKKAAVYLFRSLIDPIRAASQPQISSGTQGVTSQS